MFEISSEKEEAKIKHNYNPEIGYSEELKTDNVTGKFGHLKSLESLKRNKSPLISSSRQNTERKLELENQTLAIVDEIKASFDSNSGPPETRTSFYKIGRVLGKGAFGKVNLAMHILAKRLGEL